MIKKKEIKAIVSVLKKEITSFTEPLVDQIILECGKDPYLILISCLLSLRAKDIVTIHVCRHLFTIVKTPQEMIELPRHELESLIYKTGFYKNKAQVLQHVSHELIDRFDGRVPDTAEELLSIKGIGLKTANLVLGLAFDQASICVDTHVHRISNRLGLIVTKTAEESEQALRRLLPKKYWTLWNKLLVMWGQNMCTPVSPKCSRCPLREMCKQVGVIKNR